MIIEDADGDAAGPLGKEMAQLTNLRVVRTLHAWYTTYTTGKRNRCFATSTKTLKLCIFKCYHGIKLPLASYYQTK
jgi:hypothetical protein